MGLPTFVIRENNSYINKQIINTLYTTIPINNATLKKKKKKKNCAVKCCRVQGPVWRREMRDFPEILWLMFGFIRCPAPSTASK